MLLEELGKERGEVYLGGGEKRNGRGGGSYGRRDATPAATADAFYSHRLVLFFI